jgi:hypothetical protein
MRKTWWTAAFLALAGAAAADDARVEVPRGPSFGSNRYDTELVPRGGVPDADDYVAALAAGETLTVEVAAGARSALRPVMRLVDPGGSEIDPGARVRGGGRGVSLRRFAIPATGLWTVRVAGDGGTQGGYGVRFGVGPPVRTLRARGTIGGSGAPESVQAFDAVDGSALSVTLTAAPRDGPLSVALRGPSGRDLPLPQSTTDGGRVVLRNVPLSDGHGAYALRVTTAGAEASWRLALTVRPPERPRGRTRLTPDEPFLTERFAPAEVSPGGLLEIAGAHFPVTIPRPRVFVGEVEAPVVDVPAGGFRILAAAPDLPDGTLAGVTVQNPDGQSATRGDYVVYVRPVPLDILSISPAAAAVQQNGRRTFTVTLTRPAPPLGAEVRLEAFGVGTVPPRVVVAGGGRTAKFDLVAAPSPAAGRVVATSTSSVQADVVVTPPAALASIDPAQVDVIEGAAQTFKVALDAPAPPGGIDVEVTATPGVGTAPQFVHAAEGADALWFSLVAGPRRATGTVTVRAANEVEAGVAVVAPTTVDLSGWRLEQANSSRSFTIPAGTVLAEGSYLVVGRSATRAQFETYWGRTLSTNVRYLDGGDQWPNINGSETFALRDASGAVVDGPTIGMSAAGGQALERAAGLPAGDAASWTARTSTPVSNATPGMGQGVASVPPGVYVSEFSDADGSGNYVYEFVEVFFDRLP